jgi:nucleoside-diphosphate-sugar epimerase
MSDTSAPLFGRLLLTGAAGGLGRVLRPRLARRCA